MNNPNIPVPAPDHQINERLLSMASLFESEFTIDWLLELSGMKAHQILPVFEKKVEERILVSKRLGIYAWAPGIERKNFQNNLTNKELPAIHTQIADLLIRDLPEDDAKTLKIGPHLLNVKNNLEDCYSLIRAGDLNRKLFRTKQALNYYTKALEDLEEITGEDVDRLFIETAIKDSRFSTARRDKNYVIATLKKALKRAKKNKTLSAQSLLEMHIAKHEWLRENYDLAITHFEKGWTQAKAVDDPYVNRTATSFGAHFLYWQGRFREAVESYNKVISDVESSPTERFHMMGKAAIGFCYAQTGHITQGLGMLDAIRTLSLERGDIFMEAQAIGHMGEIMLGIRQIDDSIKYLKKGVKLSEQSNQRYTWIILQVMLAFAYHLNDQNRQAKNHLKIFLDHSHEVQAFAHPHPYILALCYSMRQGRLPKVEGLSLEKEVKRMIRSYNIYMKGLAYRFQAFLYIEKGASSATIVRAFGKSIKWLTESGHQIALSTSKIELARHYLKIGKESKARVLILQAYELFSTYNESLFPDELRSFVEPSTDNQGLLKEIMNLGQQVATIRNYKKLMQVVISSINRVTGAERGAIFLLEEDESQKLRPRFRASRNLTQSQIKQESFKPSMDLITEVANTRKGTIKSKKGAPDASNDIIWSMVCVPMILYDKCIGVLYHDNRLLSSAFKEKDIEVLSYFATQAAIALDNAKAYEEIKQLNYELMEEKQYLEEEHQSLLNFDEIIGKSHAIQKVLNRIEQVAGTEAAVLITGETGVGKELVARAIHQHSSRNNKSFISVHLSSLPDGLISSELFGHEKGAFTGATRRQTGRVELANGGTLFLDEIGEISLELQVKLLRVLQTRKFERIGGMETISSDFRLVVATNKNLEQEIKNKRFRADLYYRLNVFPIEVPLLQERKEDVPILANHFLKIHSRKLGKALNPIPNDEVKKMTAYSWPGNVRELENVIERGCILSNGRKFRIPDLDLSARFKTDEYKFDSLAAIDKRHILRTLKKTNWKVAGPEGAASLLGLTPSTLYFRMKKLGIKRPKENQQKQTSALRIKAPDKSL